ncbi:hypothetical protein AAOE16_04835 [Ekhidna sp. MALMAid0563]|uniref:hypothetical protein n=1 Tax=Ekhidna sp. MALMAid0563 TaxID=3143937 RepID=UPI0032DFB35B
MRVVYIFLISAICVISFRCSDDSEVKDEVIACFEIETQTFYVGSPIRVRSCSDDADNYEWSVNGTIKSYSDSLVFIPDEEGTYLIELTVYNKNKSDHVQESIAVGNYSGLVIQREYPEETTRLKSVFLTNDGGLLLDYNSNDVFIADSYHYKLLKLNNQLQEEWTWKSPNYFTSYNNSTLYETPNSKYLFTKNMRISGYESGYFYELNGSDGTTELLELPYQEDGFLSYTTAGDSLIYVGFGGNQDDYDLVLQTTNKFGNVSDSPIAIDFPNKSVVGHDIESNDDGYLVLGMINDIGADKTNQEILLVQLNTDYAISWSKTFELTNIDRFANEGKDESWELIKDENGDYLICTYPLVIKVNDDGDIIWEKNFETNSFPGLADGHVRKIGENYLMSLWHQLILFNSDGDEIWRVKTFPKFINDAIVLDDHIYLFVAIEKVVTQGDQSQQVHEIHINKLDMNGNYVDF